MADHPPYIDADPVPSPLMPPQLRPVASQPSPRRAVVQRRIARLKRQIMVSSVVVFALFVGLISGVLQSVGNWFSGQFFTASNQQNDDGNNFFNQGNNNGSSGGSNVGSSPGFGPPVSGSGGS